MNRQPAKGRQLSAISIRGRDGTGRTEARSLERHPAAHRLAGLAPPPYPTRPQRNLAYLAAWRLILTQTDAFRSHPPARDPLTGTARAA